MRCRPLSSLVAAVWLTGCAVARFDIPGADDEAAYAAANPYYAEYCALSQIKKKPGFGADIRGQIGGHAVFYLEGACVLEGAHYPVLGLCPGTPSDGVGISMNAHFKNAKWVATPGRDFFFGGNLPPGTHLTRAAYNAVRTEAERRRIYDGVTFHAVVFDDKPPGWSDEDWKYEVSIATDWGIALGRGRYCARVPVTRAQMVRMIRFLNEQNAPYREGRRTFDWSVFNDNCIHLAHNALAAAGLQEPWPIERFLPIAIFDFPVPKNEFVNLMRRTNDEWLGDPGAVYADVPARGELLDYDRLPTGPGALAEARGPLPANDVYDTDVKLVFYDESNFGSYQQHFDRIFADARYTSATHNRAHFATLARAALQQRKPLDWWLDRAPYHNDRAGFTAVYDHFYRLMDRLAAS